MSGCTCLWLMFPVLPLAIACGDPAPPPAEAGAIVNVGASPGGGACTVGAGVSKFGTPPTTTDPGVTLVSGHDGVRINCSVSDTGDGTLRFNGSIETSNASLSIGGTVTPGATGTASLSLYDSATSTIDLNDPACTVSLDQGMLSAEPGAIWASFRCSSLKNPTTIGLLCGANGVFLFKSCAE